MPTKNPRIAVTLKPSSALVLRTMAKLSKRSQSAIVSDMIEQGMPIFQRVVRVLQAAQEAQRGASRRVVDGLSAAQDHIERQLGLMEQDLDTRTGDLLGGLETIHRKSAGRPGSRGAAAGSPPLLTGGVDTPAPNRAIRTHRPKTKGRRSRHGA
jgi:hypothetical protein